MSALARRLGCTEGQLSTALIGLTLAIVLFAIGIPPVLRNDSLSAAPAIAAAPSAPEASAPTTTTTTAAPGGAMPTTFGPPSFAPATTAVLPASATPSEPAPSSPPSSPLPRSVVDAGYTSSSAGTPLSGPEVPEDGMPVGVRLGRVDKVSFARLAGSAPDLNLVLVEDQAANQLVALAAVRVCAVTEPGWVIDTPGAPPEDGPDHDDRRCADGAQTPSGAWTFDLTGLGEIDERAGIALLPVFEGPVTFQVTFSTVAVTGTEA